MFSKELLFYLSSVESKKIFVSEEKSFDNHSTARAMYYLILKSSEEPKKA